MRAVTGFCCLLLVVLAGCGGEGRVSTTPAVEGEYRLVPAGSADHLAGFLAEGRRQAQAGSLPSQQLLGAPATLPAESTFEGVADTVGGAAETPAAGDGVPRLDDGLTNVQVAGVDEADVVKSDGAYLYVAEQPDPWLYPLPVASMPDGDMPVALVEPMLSAPAPAASPRIARYRLDGGTPVALSPLELEGGAGYTSSLQLFLSGGEQPRLVAIGQSNDWQWQDWFSPQPYSVVQETRLWLFGMANPAAVPAPVTMTLAGELVESRRIGDRLYLVSRYYPGEGDALLPVWTVDGVVRQLVDPAKCLLPAQTSGYPVLTMLVAIDLANPAASSAGCYAGEVYTAYMSLDALYVATTRSNPLFETVSEAVVAGGTTVTADAVSGEAPVETLVHRFDLGDGAPAYVASGRVAGGFTGWTGTGSQPRWRFHERDGRLFLVTSWWDSDDLRHQLYVLAPDADGELALLATLPNSLQPAAIGKPGEDIQSMRYVGDRAYIVTFLQTDPLYVLDLADPLAPRVAGELELPGFSAYLHPLGSDWLLGIGRGPAGGVEANLFDVRDPARPQLSRNLSLCSDCDTPLMTDYHAIAVLGAGGQTRVALPLQRWDMFTAEDWRPQEQAVLLDVGPMGDLRETGRQDAAREYTSLGRVLLIGDAVLQPQIGHVTAGNWPAP